MRLRRPPEEEQSAGIRFFERTTAINSEQLKDIIVNALEDRKAVDTAVFDVRGVCVQTDFYVVASAESAPHLNALKNAVLRDLKNESHIRGRVSGDAESAWIVIDFADVIVHVFSKEARAYYDIESLWRNPPEDK